MVHHSDLFLDEFDDEDSHRQGIWFEEGMAEYISRSYFYSEDEFEQGLAVNHELVALYQTKYQPDNLETFGSASYDGDYTKMFGEYWRSVLAVDSLVKKYGSVQAVFDHYHAWAKAQTDLNLCQWFELEEY